MSSSKTRPGRNEPCHCGSGRKYKKCCLAADEEAARTGRASAAPADAGKQLPEIEEVPPPAAAADRRWGATRDDEEGGDDDGAGDDDGDLLDTDAGPEDELQHEFWQPPPIPEATPEAQAVVDAWWKRFRPVYRAMDLDAMHALMDEFLAAHPDLVPHLYLHEECLLEWESALCGAGRWNELVDRLRRLRRDLPLAYDQGFYYLDNALATGLLATGRAAELGTLLDRFAAYPGADWGALSRMLDVLLVANRQEDAFALARATTRPSAGASGGPGHGPGRRWVLLQAAIPVYEQRSDSAAAAAALVKAYGAIELPWAQEAALAGAKDALQAAFAPVDWAVPGTGRLKKEEAEPLCAHFWVWLHDTQGMSWATAAFFADRLRDLCDDAPLRKRLLRSPLGLTERVLDTFVCDAYMDFLTLNGIRAIALLQALWFYADFLVAMGAYRSEATEPLRQACRSLYASLVKALEATDAGPHLFARFPEYGFASPQAPA